MLAVASIEGAIAVSRVQRDLQPIEDVRREVRALILNVTKEPRMSKPRMSKRVPSR